MLTHSVPGARFTDLSLPGSFSDQKLIQRVEVSDLDPIFILIHLMNLFILSKVDASLPVSVWHLKDPSNMLSVECMKILYPGALMSTLLYPGALMSIMFNHNVKDQVSQGARELKKGSFFFKTSFLCVVLGVPALAL